MVNGEQTDFTHVPISSIILIVRLTGECYGHQRSGERTPSSQCVRDGFGPLHPPLSRARTHIHTRVPHNANQLMNSVFILCTS